MSDTVTRPRPGSEYDLDPALCLESRIDAAAGAALTARWEFGRWMLTHVPEGKKNLPHGFFAPLIEATGKSRAELANRRQFAEYFDAHTLSNAVRQSFSWHEISNNLLGGRSPGPSAEGPGAAWDVPEDLFRELDQEFGFQLDVCASPDAARCEASFSAEASLRQPWKGTCWLQPPPGPGIEQWVAKARRATESHSSTVVCALPARVEASWWWDHCLAAEIRFLRGVPSAIVVFGRKARVRWWDRGSGIRTATGARELESAS